VSAAETWIPGEMLDAAEAAYDQAVRAGGPDRAPSENHRAAVREALLAGFTFAGRVEVWAAHNHLRGDSLLGAVKRELMASYPGAENDADLPARPGRWAELRDFADRHVTEGEAACGGRLDEGFAAGRLVGELAAYRKMRTRMEELETGQ
jgi:hypothetical protein